MKRNFRIWTGPCYYTVCRLLHLFAPIILQQILEKSAKDFHGVAGIYVYCPGKNIEAGVNADTLFPTASMIKVPILCTLWDEIAFG